MLYPDPKLETDQIAPKLDIRPCTQGDVAAIKGLHDKVFGPGRFARTAYRIREGLSAPPGAAANCSCVGWLGDKRAAAVTMTPITIGGQPGAMLLGPLVVAPQFAGKGLGQPMVEAALKAAAGAGSALVILVGDHSYYSRFGFEIVSAGLITLPGPVALNRVLALALKPGALLKFSGLVHAEGPF